MENLLELSFTIKLQETFQNSWVAALAQTGVAQGRYYGLLHF